MKDRVEVATLSQLREQSTAQVEVDGREIALFFIEGVVHAVDNTCIHRGGPLCEGRIDGTVVTCPWHGWRFDLETGRCLDVPKAGVERFEVKVEGGKVFLRNSD